MEFIRTTIVLLGPALKSVGPAGRAMIVAALILAIGVGSYLMNHPTAQKQVMLFGGRDLSRAEINTIENALGAAGCNDYEVVENHIQIPIACRSEVLKTIDEAGATPRSVSGLNTREQTFNPFLTGSQQKSLEKEKKQQKICAMIREINGISEVMVEYDETRSTGFPRTTQRTAAVTVRPDGKRTLENYEVETIRSMVRRAVAGMEPDDIVVIDGNSGIAHQWQANQRDSQTLRDYAAAKHRFEATWKQKIESVLKSYPGAEISVQVEFDRVARVDVARVDNERPHTSASPIQTASHHKRAVQTPIAQPTRIPQHRAPKQRAHARFRNGMPGSNGQARIADALIEENANNKVFSMPVSKRVSPPATVQTAVAQPTIQQPTNEQTLTQPAVTQAGYVQQHVASENSDYVPASASVSIVIPQALVANYARRIAIVRQNELAKTKSADGQTSETGSGQSNAPEITNNDIDNCFAKLQNDITQRITPLLPGNHQANDPQRFIAVSMDMNLQAPTDIESHASGFDAQQVLSKIDVNSLKENWYAWAIPLFAVVGLVMFRINSRNAATARRERIQQEMEARQQERSRQREPQQITPPEIEHNELEATEQEVQLTSDIDKAFENEHDSGLSKEVVDMIKDDPETTVRVFRNWLNEVKV